MRNKLMARIIITVLVALMCLSVLSALLNL